MNMTHVLDSRYRDRYPFDIYSGTVYAARSIDADGRLHEVAKNAMLNELQVHIKPSRIVDVLQPDRDTFRALKIGDTDFFIWDLPLWERLCVAHIEQSLDAYSVPCWLAELEKHVAPGKHSSATGQ